MHWIEWQDYLSGYFKALVHVAKLSEWPWEAAAAWVGAIGSVVAAFIALLSVGQAKVAAEDSRAAAREARNDEAIRADALLRRSQKDEALRHASETKALLLRIQAEAVAIEAELNSFSAMISRISTYEGLLGRPPLTKMFNEIQEKRTDLEERLAAIEAQVLPYDPTTSEVTLDAPQHTLRQIKAEADALEAYTRAATQDHRSRLLRRQRPTATSENPSTPTGPQSLAPEDTDDQS